ncbi:MAG TPA: adenylate/guanylate cyclase domain-containing protein [Spirochaetia bacterium]|nr:adenylate/guanylate cyclase domain-containing protein [Spirochaetia bacterium]
MGYRFRVQSSASEDRLAELIEQRLKPGADKKMIDARIWDLFGEDWAIMFTDLSGFSRKVAEFGIIHFLQIIHESERILIPCVADHDGILLKTEGDSLLIIFRSVRKAIECAIDMQRRLKTYNVDRNDAEKVLLCLGIGFGPVLRIGDADVFGAEVNAASKLGEDTAEAWEILVTQSVRDAATDDGDISFELLPDAPPGAAAAYRLIYRL